MGFNTDPFFPKWVGYFSSLPANQRRWADFCLKRLQHKPISVTKRFGAAQDIQHSS
jgi:hypothetical protein